MVYLTMVKELSDAAAALDWIERQNLDYSQCWVSGFSFWFINLYATYNEKTRSK